MKKMKTNDTLKLLGLLSTGLGFAVSIFANWVQQKNMDQTIKDQVQEAISNQIKES